MTGAPEAGPEHLDLEALAALDEGLLPTETAARHTAHLDDCPRCQASSGRLRETRALLSALPPDRIPPAVATRLDSALRAALPLVTTPVRRRSWRTHPSAAAFAAAAAAVALVAAVVLGTTLSGSDSSEQAAGPDSARSSASAASPPAQFPVLSRDATYTRQNAGRLVAQLVPPTGAGAAEAATAQHPVDPALNPLFTSRAQLLQCVAKLSGDTTTGPLAVDFGHYTDKDTVGEDLPAVLILLPGLSPGRADGYIVGPDCATAPDQNLYLYQTVSASG